MQSIGLTYEWSLGVPHTITVRKFQLETMTQMEAIQGRYTPLTKSQEEFRTDVSSAVGLFERKGEIGANENARLERCLSDLLIVMIQPALSESGSQILIVGPAMPKLIGRIGYRYPRPDITIAFVTWDSAQSRSVRVMEKTHEWEGPFPGYEDGRIARAYLACSAPVRVDLFSQGLNRYGADETFEGRPVGAITKLETASKYIMEFADFCRTRKTGQHELEFGLQLDLQKKAARDDTPRKVPGPSTRYPDSGQTTRPLDSSLDEVIFNGISAITTGTEVGRKRFEVLRDFFEIEKLGAFVERMEFVRLVESEVSKVRNRRIYVYDLKQLALWYLKYEAGR